MFDLVALHLRVLHFRPSCLAITSSAFSQAAHSASRKPSFSNDQEALADADKALSDAREIGQDMSPRPGGVSTSSSSTRPIRRGREKSCSVANAMRPANAA